MRNVVIGIHGLGNKPSKEVLQSWWMQSIHEGAKRNSIDLPSFDIEFVYWADILHPIPQDPQVSDPESPLFIEDPYIPTMHSKVPNPHNLRGRITHYLEEKLSKLLLNDDLTINYQSVTDSLIKRYFQDLERYYSDEEGTLYRDRIRDRLVTTLRKHKNDRIILIAHSMGSIVAFDVLDMNPDLHVDTLVTIGSPLGFPIVVARMGQERKQQHAGSKVIRTPDTIKRAWYNLADLEDNVAFDFNIATDYSGNSFGVKPVDRQVDNDYEYRRKRNPHKSYGYLRTKELNSILAEFLNVKGRGWFDPIRQLFSRQETTEPVSQHTPSFLPDSILQPGVKLDRSSALDLLRLGEEEWDIIVVGGGATGMGVAVESASRGYKTLLLEQHDFGKGTSSRSTKLVHGGVRYLQQGNIALVLEALQERAILRQNAPHLVHDLPFIVPNYDWWGGSFYGIGLRIYDLLAGKHGFGPSVNLSVEETVEAIPQIETEGLRGGVQYHDGQFDDARLVINLAQTAADEGASVINYTKVKKILKTNNVVCGVVAVDEFTNEEFEILGKCVVNATGIFTDEVRTMDDPDCERVMTTSRGVHVVLDKSFLGGDTAIMVPHTDDGRVLFAIPWLGKVVIGTTETKVEAPELEPVASEEEIEFILKHAAKYLTQDPKPEDVRSVFAGLRPLVKQGSAENTAAISREHQILISASGLLTITGGKWTTYRLMAEETMDKALILAKLPYVPSQTKNLAIQGWDKDSQVFGVLAHYGADAYALEKLIDDDPGLGKPLHENLPINEAMILWAVREEIACSVEDVLARRTRCLLLDAKASMDIAVKVAKVMAHEMDKDKEWVKSQVQDYKKLVAKYILPG